MHTYIHTCIHSYIHTYIRALSSQAPASGAASDMASVGTGELLPVSVRRFPSFRTQPLENITPLPMNKWVPEQPSPWRKYSKRESYYGDRVYPGVCFGTCVWGGFNK